MSVPDLLQAAAASAQVEPQEGKPCSALSMPNRHGATFSQAKYLKDSAKEIQILLEMNIYEHSKVVQDDRKLPFLLDPQRFGFTSV